MTSVPTKPVAPATINFMLLVLSRENVFGELSLSYYIRSNKTDTEFNLSPFPVLVSIRSIDAQSSLPNWPKGNDVMFQTIGFVVLAYAV